MRVLLLLLFSLIGGCMGTFTRNDVLQCVKEKIDLNHDDAVTRDEIHYIIDTYGTFKQRIYFNLMNGMTRIFQDCDYDKNGILTVRDFTMTESTCFAKPEQIANMETLCNQIKM